MDLAWALAFAVGTGTSLVELLSRYRDEPLKVIATSQFAWVYLFLNGLLAIGAYFVLIQSEYVQAETGTSRGMLGLAAGLGAAVILRSRVFTAQLGDEQVSIGPGYVIDQLLSTIDAQIDRRRALQRVQIVVEVMKGKDFEGAKTHASTMITGSRQNLTLQEQKDLANQIREVSDRKIPDQQRSFALGFILLDFMGEDFLRTVAHELPTVEEIVDEDNGTATTVVIQDGDITSTGKIVKRNWGASLPVQRADSVRELLSGVPLAQVCARVDELLGRGELGRSEGERMALRHEIDRVLDRTDLSDEDKVFGVGFAVHGVVDSRSFRDAFEDLAELSRRSSERSMARGQGVGKAEPGQKPAVAPISRRRQPSGPTKPVPPREESAVDKPITGRHPTIGSPAGPMPAANSGGDEGG